MEVKRWELMPHVYLTYLPARKFKTGVLSAQFITPLAKETASYNALLPAVQHRRHHALPGHGAALCGHGSALRRTDQPHHPQAGGDAVPWLRGQLYRRPVRLPE